MTAMSHTSEIVIARGLRISADNVVIDSSDKIGVF